MQASHAPIAMVARDMEDAHSVGQNPSAPGTAMVQFMNSSWLERSSLQVNIPT